MMMKWADSGLGRAAAALLAAVLVATACDSPSDSGSRTPAAIAVVSGADQQGTAGQELPDPVVVKVTDSKGRPVAGQAVTFHVAAGGGSVFSGSATTDANGIAQERWTVGTVAGSVQTLDARVVNGSGATLTATFTATVKAGAPAQLVRVNASATLAGVVTSVVADTPAVRVLDASGNGVPGATVTWAVGAGSGTTAAATSVTDANGVAKIAWTLGPPSSGLQSLTASIPGVPAVGFAARAGSDLRFLQANGANVSAGVPVAVTVALNDAIGPVSGALVQWQASGGGTVSPATSLTGSGGSGIASATWTPGPASGPQTLTATAGSLTATLTVIVLGSATRTLLAQVPGTVLDVSLDAVLWLDASGAAPAFKRRLPNGTDQTAGVSPGTGQLNAVQGFLYNGGALLRTQTGQFYLWRNDGSELPLGVGEGLASVEGQWAAWRASSAEVVRVDLSTGSSVHLATPNATSVDVGADGDVVWLDDAHTPWLYNGTASQLTTVGDGSLEVIATDGVNIVYEKFTASNAAYLYLEKGSNDVGLTFNAGQGGRGTIWFALNGGWMAYNTPISQVVRRTPQGFFQNASPEAASGLEVVAIASDGTVVYENHATGRDYLVTAPTVGVNTRYDAGPALGTSYIARGPYLFAIQGTAVYRVAP